MKYKPTVLITGASRGLGLELAKVFANAEHNLILHSKKNPLPIFNGKNVNFRSYKGDLRSQKTISGLKKLAEQMDVDILVNNAAQYLCGELNSLSYDRIKEIIEINLIAPINLVKSILPIFRKKRNGLIVNINSLACENGAKHETVYSSSKCGMDGFFKILKKETSKNNIKILNIFLGAMKTDMVKHRPDYNNLIDPSEAAKVILDLCYKFKTMYISKITINRALK